jgi:hypothetical protein
LVWVGECVWLPNQHLTILTGWRTIRANQLVSELSNVSHDWAIAPADTLHSL